MNSAKTITVLLILLPLSLLSIPLTYGQTPFDITFCSRGVVKPISSGDELTLYSWEHDGTVRSNHENTIFDNLKGFCVGVRNDSGGGSQNLGYCRYKDPDGDIFFAELHVFPPEWDWKILGGTGKWKGISGMGKTQLLEGGKAIEEGWYQWSEEGIYQCCERTAGMFQFME